MTIRSSISPLPSRCATVVRGLVVVVAATLVGGCDQSAKPGAKSVLPAGQVIADRQESDKLNAYVEAYNRLLQWHDFRKELAKYQRDNPGLRGASKAKVTSYSMPTGELQRPLEAFDRALAITSALPELDSLGRTLRDALGKLDPLVREGMAYEKTKGYLADQGEKGRQMDAPFIAALAAAADATKAFGAVLSAQTHKRDEAELASLKPGAVQYQKLKVSLGVRKLSTSVRAAMQQDPGAADQVRTSLQAVEAANVELGRLKRDPKAQPAWDPICEMYKSKVDSLIGLTRTLQVKLGEGGREAAVDTANEWSKLRNESIDAENNCGH